MTYIKSFGRAPQSAYPFPFLVLQYSVIIARCCNSVSWVLAPSVRTRGGVWTHSPPFFFWFRMCVGSIGVVGAFHGSRVGPVYRLPVGQLQGPSTAAIWAWVPTSESLWPIFPTGTGWRIRVGSRGSKKKSESVVCLSAVTVLGAINLHRVTPHPKHRTFCSNNHRHLDLNRLVRSVPCRRAQNHLVELARLRLHR